jgi:hypothetical protein
MMKTQTPRIADTDDRFIERILELWDAKYDTFEMGKLLDEPEHVVARALRMGRERRRQK